MPITQTVRAAVSGMMSHQLKVDLIANNLANTETAGFKAGRLTFQDLLYQAHRFAPDEANVRVGGGVRPAALQPVFTQGALHRTDTPTDLAIYGDGFFRVQLPDGTEGYTRNGSFRTDATGRLVTQDGLRLVPEITVPAGEAALVQVGSDGIVYVSRPGETQPQELGRIELARFTNPEGLEAIGQTLYRATANSGPAQVGQADSPGYGQVVAGAVEGSNVNMAEEMSTLIVAQRAYGLSVKALQTADEMLSLANNLRK
jgi:flagellar basal-body rod protein FlgG